MRNASNVSVMDMSNSTQKVDLKVSWMQGPKGQQEKITVPQSPSLILLGLDDDTEVTVEGIIGKNAIIEKFNYKQNAGPIKIKVYGDGTYSINQPG